MLMAAISSIHLFPDGHLGEAAVYLAQHEPGPGPVLQELIAKVQKAAGT